MVSLVDYSPDSRSRYVYGIQSGQFIKVGVASNVDDRLRTMRLSNPHPLVVIFKRKMLAAFYCEKKMHEILADKAHGREWFHATPAEVLAAAEVGTLYARELHALARKRTDRSRRADARLTQATFDNARNPYKTGTT